VRLDDLHFIALSEDTDGSLASPVDRYSV